MTTETRFDTVHYSILERWYGMTINELVEEKEKIIRKINLATKESYDIKEELTRVLTHLESFIDRRIKEENDKKDVDNI